METQQQPVAQHQPQKVHQDRNMKGKTIMFLLAIILLAIGAGAGWWWRDKDAKALDKTKQSEITALGSQITQLQKDLVEAKKTTTTTTTTTTSTGVRPSAATLTSIQDAIKSGNTAALEGYMASTVKVIIAASEGVGDRTPAQAVSDLSYLNSATDPWDFALPAATLTTYQTGNYKQHFPTTALVGKSANKYVVSFQFDGSGKISGVFMAASSDLLQ